ncbi:MAG: DUF4131 domain-containing protein, partial [Betaproteobacteria bacterium]|nr:DUF4131 domain-containing protein [Betaproteobacteria bacterium]
MNGLLVTAPAFAAGMLLLQRQAVLPPTGWAALLALIALVAVLVAARAAARTAGHDAAPSLAARPWAVRSARFALTLAIAFGAGFGWAALRAELALSDALDRQWEGRDLTVTGVIASLPQPFARGVRFDFDIEAAVLPASLPAAEGQDAGAMREPLPGIPSKISLAWYNGLSPEEFQEV